MRPGDIVRYREGGSNKWLRGAIFILKEFDRVEHRWRVAVVGATEGMPKLPDDWAANPYAFESNLEVIGHVQEDD